MQQKFIQYNILDMEFWWDDVNECKMKCKKEIGYKIFILIYGVSIINIGNLPFCVFKIFEIVNWVIKQNLDYAMRTLLLRSKHITVRGYRKPNIKHYHLLVYIAASFICTVVEVKSYILPECISTGHFHKCVCKYVLSVLKYTICI